MRGTQDAGANISCILTHQMNKWSKMIWFKSWSLMLFFSGTSIQIIKYTTALWNTQFMQIMLNNIDCPNKSAEFKLKKFFFLRKYRNFDLIIKYTCENCVWNNTYGKCPPGLCWDTCCLLTAFLIAVCHNVADFSDTDSILFLQGNI